MDSRKSDGGCHLIDVARVFFCCLFDSLCGKYGIVAMIRIFPTKIRRMRRFFDSLAISARINRHLRVTGMSSQGERARRFAPLPTLRLLQVRRAGLPDADHVAIRRTNGGATGMLYAPALILTAEDAVARYAAAMPVRPAAAQCECRRDCRRHDGRNNNNSEEHRSKRFHG